jgi:hypothetical protein
MGHFNAAIRPSNACFLTPPFLGFRIVRVALGLLLLAAAGLKAYGLTLDPLARPYLLSSPRLEIAAIEVEMILGLWLLSGWSVRGAWLAALAYFRALSILI